MSFPYYSFERDLRLHKLVFEEDVLPDGTEVAYYSRGQVVAMTRISTNHIYIRTRTHTYINLLDFFLSIDLLAEIVGRLQKGDWNLLYLLQLWGKLVYSDYHVCQKCLLSFGIFSERLYVLLNIVRARD